MYRALLRYDPIIGSLNQEDLNQRFRNTVVHYRGKFQTCLGFQGGNILLSQETGLFIEPFAKERLLIGRMPPQWTVVRVESGVIAGYFYYIPRRQYSRGWSQNNCSVYSPVHNTSINITPEILESLSFEPKPRIVCSLDEVIKDVGKNNFKILSSDLCVSTYRHGYGSKVKRKVSVFYRATRVAEVEVTKGGLQFFHKNFEHEVRESIQ